MGMRLDSTRRELRANIAKTDGDCARRAAAALVGRVRRSRNPTKPRTRPAFFLAEHRPHQRPNQSAHRVRRQIIQAGLLARQINRMPFIEPAGQDCTGNSRQRRAPATQLTAQANGEGLCAEHKQAGQNAPCHQRTCRSQVSRQNAS